MMFKIPLFLEQDTIDHIDAVAEALARKNGTHPNRSDAVKHMVAKHWMATVKRKSQKARKLTA